MEISHARAPPLLVRLICVQKSSLSSSRLRCKNYPYFRGHFVAGFPPRCGPVASLFRRFTDTDVYATGSVEIWNTHHKISVEVMLLGFAACGRSYKATTSRHCPGTARTSLLWNGVSCRCMCKERCVSPFVQRVYYIVVSRH